MSDTAIAPIEKQRVQVFKKMPVALQEVAKDFEQKLGRGAVGVIMIQYTMGARIAEVLGDEGTYGSGAVSQLASYLPVPGNSPKTKEQLLYNLRNFAAAFDKNYVQEWSNKPMANGHYLELAHWLQLMKVADKKAQEKLLNRAIKSSLSAGDLEKEVQSGAAGGTKNTRQGGRHPKMPSSAIAGLQTTFGMAQKLNNYSPVADEKVFSVINEMPADEITEALATTLQKTIDALKTTKGQAGEMLTKANDCMDRVRGILDQKSSEDAEEGEEAEAEEEAPKKKSGKAKAANGAAGKKKVKKKKVVAAVDGDDED